MIGRKGIWIMVVSLLDLIDDGVGIVFRPTWISSMAPKNEFI
jgi:hypothetical protein